MKFSHTLSLNSNPDWVDHYLDYAGLKKDISDIRERCDVDNGNKKKKHWDDDEQQQQQQHEEEEEERVMMMMMVLDEARDQFLTKLTKMVTDVRQFYDHKKYINN